MIIKDINIKKTEHVKDRAYNMSSEVENKSVINNTINQDRIQDLNLDISLASTHLHLVKKIPITDINDIFCCLLLSNTAKKLYNSALYLFKKQYWENQTTLTYETLDKLIKNEELYPNFARLYQDLTAKVSQQVLKLFSQNVRSFFALKQSKKLTEDQKKKLNLPRYYTKNGLAPIYYTNQALSQKSFNEEGVIHFAGTDLKIKLDRDTIPEITHFSQINQVRIIPSTKNDKNKSLSDLFEEYCSGDSNQLSFAPLFTVEIVYTAPLTKQRISNQSLNLRYETKITQKVRKKDNKVYEIKTQELVEVSYTEEFLKYVAGIDQNLDQLAVGIVTPEETLTFNYDIKYLKSVNQYWNKQKARLQEEISKQEKLLEELAEQDNLELKIIDGDSSKSKLVEAINHKKILIKRLKNKIKRITTKRNRKIDNYVHQLSRKLINHLSQLGVKNIIYGKNVNFKQEINLGKVTNQNFVNIPFNLIIERLRYKAALAGINFMTVEESYTSKTSFLDREKLHSYKSDKAPKKYNFLGNRFTRSLFKSKDGYIIHADTNASFNTIRKVSGDSIYNFVEMASIKGSSPKRVKISIQ